MRINILYECLKLFKDETIGNQKNGKFEDVKEDVLENIK